MTLICKTVRPTASATRRSRWPNLTGAGLLLAGNDFLSLSSYNITKQTFINMSQRSARRFTVIWFKIAHTAGIILQRPQQFRPNDKHRAGDKTAVFGTQPHFRQHFIGTGIGKPVFPLRFDYQIVMRNHSGFGIAKKRQRPPQLFGRSHKTGPAAVSSRCR